MRRPFAWFDPRRLAFRLYGLLGLAVLSLMVLALAGSHVAHRTASAAHVLSRTGVDGVVLSAELQVLLERHRRIVETAPGDVDPDHVRTARSTLNGIEARIFALTTHGDVPGDLPAVRDVARQLPTLFTQAASALRHREAREVNAAHEAVEAYESLAIAVEAAARVIRDDRATAADDMLDRLTGYAQTLTTWGAGAVLVALIVVGPLGLLVLGDAARRLKSVWRTMRRLASNDTTAPVPSLADADEIGEMARAVQVFKDNALALARNRREVDQAKAWLDIALNNMARGLSMFDVAHRLVLCNRTYREIYGLPEHLARHGASAAEILAHRTARIVRVELGEGEIATDTEVRMEDLLAMNRTFSVYQHLSDGRIISLANQRIADGGWVAVHEDVTRQREAEARIATMASSDALTGLANRRVFRDALDARCVAPGGPKDFALLLIDLDEFKPVNDTLGHLAGDLLLEQVAGRIRTTARGMDLVARIGGDEFAIIAERTTTSEAAAALAGRVVAAIRAPFEVDNARVEIGASVGVALAPSHGTSARELLSHADLALYRSKEDGRARFTIYDPSLEDQAEVRRTLEHELKTALERGELELHYQPIVDASQAHVVAFEALLRWRHPVRGLVPPMAFIPFAEQSGLIVPIGTWALKQACRDALAWPPHVSVSVNLSAVQVHAGRIAETVAMILAETGFPARRLELEVTESLQLADQPASREALLKLKSLGVRIALDDFGTGYASLSYLRRFPFDKLKIDRMFIADIADGGASLAIVEAVTALARSLDMVTVAEGIETGDHLDRARAAGCALLQGYLFSKPVPAGEVAAVIGRCDGAASEGNTDHRARA